MAADGASFRSATETDSGTAPPRSRGGPAEPGIAEGASSRAGAWSAAAVAAGAESFPSRRRREQGSGSPSPPRGPAAGEIAGAAGEIEIAGGACGAADGEAKAASVWARAGVY